MAQASPAIPRIENPEAPPCTRVLRSYCASIGLQRHTFFILKAVSVFYFSSLLGTSAAGRTAHGWFFASLALAPVCVGAMVKTLHAQRRAVYFGEVFLICAFACLALDWNPWIPGALLVAGIGCFNVSFKTVFSASMHRFEQELDAHFTRLYLAINAGSFLAPLLITYLFHYDPSVTPLHNMPPTSLFGWCAGCMALSLYFWWDADQSHKTKPLINPPTVEMKAPSCSLRSSIAGVLIVTAFSALFWLGFELKSGKLNQDASDPKIMQQISWLPGVQLQAVNPLVVVLLAFLFAWTWEKLRKRGRDPHPVVKMGVGMICLGVGFAVLTLGLWRAGGPISPLWFVLLYVWHSIGELFFEPIGQGFVLANVSSKYRAFFLAVWEGTAFLAFAGGAQLANVFDNHERYALFLILGSASVCAGGALLALAPRLKGMAKG